MFLQTKDALKYHIFNICDEVNERENGTNICICRPGFESREKRELCLFIANIT